MDSERKTDARRRTAEGSNVLAPVPPDLLTEVKKLRNTAPVSIGMSKQAEISGVKPTKWGSGN